jgi:hypothetical protein
MNKELIASLAWGVGILAVALGATFARKLGYADRDTVTRVVIGVNGLWMVWYGNRLPKNIVPSARACQAQRVAAWSLVLSGLVYAGLWAFAPIPVAVTVGCGAVLAGVVTTLGHCLSLRARAKVV